MEKLLKDESLRKLLEKIDDDFAQEACKNPCPHCKDKAKLHCGDYDRKPRGISGWDKRRSFCCSNRKCRKRVTPPSVRFLGRKVYVGIVVVLLGAMQHGLKPDRVETLREELGVDIRTLKRWRAWWLESFVQSKFWKAQRSRFMPPLNERVMPLSLVEKFGAGTCVGMVNLLRFLSPVTVSSGLNGCVM